MAGGYGPDHDERNFWHSKRLFAATGSGILPVLHEALRSSDRVIRSNAARACGTLGDPASVSHLIGAIDLESALSRASIVWALGELKAPEAMPLLTELFIGRGWGKEGGPRTPFLAGQSNASIDTHYANLPGRQTLEAEWDELKAGQRVKHEDPVKREDLLDESHLIRAAQKIGPKHNQDFILLLAAGGYGGSAAYMLSLGTPQQQQENLPILRALLSDPEIRVRQKAAVSLLIIGEEEARKPIAAWLDSYASNRNARYAVHNEILSALRRVESPEALSFARPHLERLAADTSLQRYDRKQARDLLDMMGVG